MNPNYYSEQHNPYNHYYYQQQQNRISESGFTIIDENAPEIAQPSRIETQLFLHQRKAVYKLSQIEQTHTILKDNIELTTDVGIYADKVGAGKSLTIATLLGIVEQPAARSNCVLGSNEYTSVVRVRTLQSSDSNLLIVPHSLIIQWKKTLTSVKELNFKVINKNTLLDTLDWDDLPDVVLISNTIFKNMTCPNNHTWNRVIIDEPQSLPLRDIPQANFTWLVCATPRDIIYPRRNYLRAIAREINVGYDNLTKMIIIKNKDEIVEASLNLPNIKETYITCKAPQLFRALGNNLPQEALVRLQANDIQGAAEVLNVNATSGDNIVDLLVRNYTDQIHNENIEIDRLRQLRNISNEDRAERIKNHQDKIATIQEKVDNIKERISTSAETCPICLDTVTAPRAITGCCHNSFCFECILMAMSADHEKKCPLCKKCGCDKTLHIEADIQGHEEVKQDVPDNEPKNKTDTLLNMLKKMNQSARYLVFSEFYNSFTRIEFKLRELGIPYATLKGTVATQEKIIDRYRTGEIQVLLLNATQFGAGLNLQMSTHVCVYHKFRDITLKDQVIGRANRFGRNGPLEVVYLAHEGEYDAQLMNN